jgi:hypothetical protein
MHCSEFHEWLIHLNTEHGALYCPYTLVLWRWVKTKDKPGLHQSVWFFSLSPEAQTPWVGDGRYDRRPWERAASAIVSLFGPPGGVAFSYLVIIKSNKIQGTPFIRFCLFYYFRDVNYCFQNVVVQGTIIIIVLCTTTFWKREAHTWNKRNCTPLFPSAQWAQLKAGTRELTFAWTRPSVKL